MALTTVAVSVYSSLATGQALSAGRVRLMLTSADVDGSLIAPTPIDAILDNNGFVIVNLWPNARGTQNSQYTASFYDSVGHHVLDVVATIPASNCNLHDHIATLVTDPGMTSLAASTGSSLVGFTQSGTGAVARTVQDKLRDSISLLDFGAVGDGTTDDTTALVNASASKVPVLVPPGKKFKCSANLTLNSAWRGAAKGQGNPGSATDTASVPYTSEIYFTGTGWAVTTKYDFENLALRGSTSVPGQSGLRMLAAIGQKAGPCRIMEFDGVACELGNSDTNSGIYFADLSIIEINNQSRVGSVGFRIRGGGAASSNGNVLRAPVVSGAWSRYAQLSGHANLILGGDFEINNDLVVSLAGAITEAIYIDGDGNTWMNPYVEPNAGTKPATIVRFASTASGNRLHRMYTPSSGSNFFSLIDDQGAENDVEIVSIGENFTPSIGRGYSENNLIPNPTFVSASPSSVPYGWQIAGATGTFTVDTSVTRGAKRTLKLSTSTSKIQADCYVASTSSLATNGAISYTPIASLQGQTVGVGVWCLSSTAGVGALKVLNGSTSYGVAAHSGSGNWEFLTVRTRIAASATNVAIRLRNSTSFTDNTGDCWFSEPVLVVGNDIPRFGGHRKLPTEDAAAMGRLTWNPPVTLAVNSATPDVTDGNFFTEANTLTTTITNFLNGRSGQELKILMTSANTTLKNNTTIQTTTGADKALSANTIYKLLYNGTKWYEY